MSGPQTTHVTHARQALTANTAHTILPHGNGYAAEGITSKDHSPLTPLTPWQR